MTVIVFLSLQFVVDDLAYKLVSRRSRIRGLRGTQGGKKQIGCKRERGGDSQHNYLTSNGTAQLPGTVASVITGPAPKIKQADKDLSEGCLFSMCNHRKL